MKKGKISKRHPRCLPPTPRVEKFAYLFRIDLNGRWHELKFKQMYGFKPHVAYLGVLKNGDATIWTAPCQCKNYLNCPVSMAFSFAADLGCSVTMLENVDKWAS